MWEEARGGLLGLLAQGCAPVCLPGLLWSLQEDQYYTTIPESLA